MYTRAGLANWVGAISVWEQSSGHQHWAGAVVATVDIFTHALSILSHGPEEHLAISPWAFPEALGFLDMSVTMSTTHILSARHSFGASSAPYTSSDPPYVSCIVTLISPRDSDPLICDKWTLVPTEPNSNWASRSPHFVWAWCMGLAFG